MRYLLFSGALALLATSCVGSKNFTVNTVPEGASVTINGKPVAGLTPITTEIQQEKDLGIVVRKQGYETTSATIKTKPHRFLGLIWTQNDPRARYIEEDEVTIPMTPIPGLSSYKPTKMPAYDGRTLPPLPTTKPSNSVPRSAPALRPMPEDL